MPGLLEIRWTSAVYGRGMLDETAFAAAAAELCATDPRSCGDRGPHGLPEFWAREPGPADARPPDPGAAGFPRLGPGGLRPARDTAGRPHHPGDPASSDAELRADGFSRQKARYVRVLSWRSRTGRSTSAACRARRRGGREALVALPGSARGRPRSTSCPHCAGPTPGRSETSPCRKVRDGRADSTFGPRPRS